jgi:hypothetical protein
MFTHKRY